ncbi:MULTISPECIES: V-type ATP synthase subunit D [Treponema]|jgi:V-type ATPase, D subunit|uniref:V-type ATP synthase subunit D n=1 Tax=Treponema socranskii subsp. socranskii VPI DR56BR1116 = ATCC 35536 TaxID=1125725 RepID=A0ABN0P7Z6_TRESO|nr:MULTISPECIES: V-type ATP synthase subunit D [Treponema]EPF27073.1 V-type ATPase, D subunit [Treponema socranskii subsp. paredis ATCC 35535]ERK04950.1 V-type ATPase, D subunit [Treponema socranskii subsp. socranskii VPI DR56BR1116 = ATCC 35536]MBC6719944.1 V-type ATP synthase subunit D [Treponema sp. Marseille-Q4130]MBM7022017.1 V-type ATP synthase subunit D [Treponema sp. Marseille-Q4523]MDR9859249.1 V-type ATP synthase subunit D [Treponema socranskii]
MAKIKLTKNEQKIQKDALKMYQRYLPTLTLKKQQLQTEIRAIDAKAREVRDARKALEKEFDEWIAVFADAESFGRDTVRVSNIRKGTGNIAGVKIPIYEGADFTRAEYDLYETPVWIDMAADRMERALELDLEAEVLDEQVRLLSKELRTTTQRVNLFEKVKIPEAKENIRKISVFLGDERVAAVVRSKISKRKLEAEAK